MFQLNRQLEVGSLCKTFLMWFVFQMAVGSDPVNVLCRGSFVAGDKRKHR